MKKLSDYIGQKIAVNCKTKEQAEAFCKLMHENGLKWVTGGSYLGRTSWERYKENTCYDFNKGEFGNIEFYQSAVYTILPATDFLEEEFVYGQEYEFSNHENFKEYYTQTFGCLYPKTNFHNFKYLSFDDKADSYGWKYCRKINTERTEAITTAKELITKFNIKQEELFKN